MIKMNRPKIGNNYPECYYNVVMGSLSKETVFGFRLGKPGGFFEK